MVEVGESRKKKKVRVALEEKNSNAHTTFLVMVGIAVLDMILGTRMEETWGKGNIWGLPFISRRRREKHG